MKTFLKTALVVVIGVLLVLFLLPGLLRNREAVPAITIRMNNLTMALKSYQKNFGVYPTGTWQEASHALMGENTKYLVFFDSRTDDEGQIIDPWGTPFSFSIETNIILKSAGPNHVFGDKDDVVRVVKY